MEKGMDKFLVGKVGRFIEVRGDLRPLGSLLATYYRGDSRVESLLSLGRVDRLGLFMMNLPKHMPEEFEFLFSDIPGIKKDFYFKFTDELRKFMKENNFQGCFLYDEGIWRFLHPNLAPGVIPIDNEFLARIERGVAELVKFLNEWKKHWDKGSDAIH